MPIAPRTTIPTDPPLGTGGAGSRLHLFRAGTYTDMHGTRVTLSAADVAASAAAYDPALHQAPIVVGHPKDNSPAFGWLSTLSAQGDDLEGEPVEVDPDFAAAVRAGRYKTRSASFWPPTHPGNPKPGVWYVRHVGFLGGAAPAVRGLRGADLAAAHDDGIVTLDLAADAALTRPCTIEDHPMPDPTLDLAVRESALTDRETELAKAAQQIATREAALAAREAAAAAQAEALRRTEIAAFCDRLAGEARIRPADAPALVTLLATLPEEPAAEFAEAGETPTPPAAFLRRFLAALPPMVELSDLATKARAGDGAPPLAEFAAPVGFQVDLEALAVLKRAQAYQAAHPETPLSAALAAVGGV